MPSHLLGPVSPEQVARDHSPPLTGRRMSQAHISEQLAPQTALQRLKDTRIKMASSHGRNTLASPPEPEVQQPADGDAAEPAAADVTTSAAPAHHASRAQRRRTRQRSMLSPGLANFLGDDVAARPAGVGTRSKRLNGSSGGASGSGGRVVQTPESRVSTGFAFPSPGKALGSGTPTLPSRAAAQSPPAAAQRRNRSRTPDALPAAGAAHEVVDLSLEQSEPQLQHDSEPPRPLQVQLKHEPVRHSNKQAAPIGSTPDVAQPSARAQTPAHLVSNAARAARTQAELDARPCAAAAQAAEQGPNWRNQSGHLGSSSMQESDESAASSPSDSSSSCSSSEAAMNEDEPAAAAAHVSEHAAAWREQRDHLAAAAAEQKQRGRGQQFGELMQALPGHGDQRGQGGQGEAAAGTSGALSMSDDSEYNVLVRPNRDPGNEAHVYKAPDPSAIIGKQPAAPVQLPGRAKRGAKHAQSLHAHARQAQATQRNGARAMAREVSDGDVGVTQWRGDARGKGRQEDEGTGARTPRKAPLDTGAFVGRSKQVNGGGDGSTTPRAGAPAGGAPPGRQKREETDVRAGQHAAMLEAYGAAATASGAAEPSAGSKEMSAPIAAESDAGGGVREGSGGHGWCEPTKQKRAGQSRDNAEDPVWAAVDQANAHQELQPQAAPAGAAQARPRQAAQPQATARARAKQVPPLVLPGDQDRPAHSPRPDASPRPARSPRPLPSGAVTARQRPAQRQQGAPRTLRATSADPAPAGRARRAADDRRAARRRRTTAWLAEKMAELDALDRQVALLQKHRRKRRAPAPSVAGAREGTASQLSASVDGFLLAERHAKAALDHAQAAAPRLPIRAPGGRAALHKQQQDACASPRGVAIAAPRNGVQARAADAARDGLAAMPSPSRIGRGHPTAPQPQQQQQQPSTSLQGDMKDSSYRADALAMPQPSKLAQAAVKGTPAKAAPPVDALKAPAIKPRAAMMACQRRAA